MNNIKNNLLKSDETLDDLQIKNIKIIQKSNGFRFGMDAVLLANFAKVKKGMRVMDLCSGTGIIPFILAGKTEAEKIFAIEIQEDMVEMGNRSITYNNLENKINIIKGDIKNVKMLKNFDKFDIVTVNPPYKLKNSGLFESR
ncbi:tRNA1(Val) (adenine(37)-N6)-methyltransferase [Clostridium acetireducens DSM 10703]|uniref:tRNA1(Val) (Adenine(37)-N6)-methyltransferase n=1 Tax=Clostridium acetireducens DSM 10703 TaxID=1121290 RepID=A0A1E8EWA4_9CLOT|nr:tRNA1(Val) (adenine(37)-N6)-methyltransferase [Clostridium acetireducens DSM 10703]